MEGGLVIALVSLAMFVGCLVLGFIPLLFTLSQKSLQLVTVLGAGLLCGTALAITIPEGVGLLEESWRASSSSSSSSSTSDVPSSLNGSDKYTTSTERGRLPRFSIGVALTLGFTFMFAVDQVASYISTRDQTTQLHKSIGITTTVGLVIHAAADGFALGAAVATGQVTVQVIVFFAVILHKAPIAFGLVSFLMHSGLEKKYIQGHLLAFSAASPVVAMTSYFILQGSGSSPQSQLSATGMGMLFSAGTFLYVATVHVLPESSRAEPDRLSTDPQQHAAGAETHQRRYMGLLESFTLVFGVGLPMVLALALRDD